MAHYVLVRCKDATAAKNAMQIIQDEYETRGICETRVGTDEEIYYAASDVAEDCSKLELLVIDPELDDEEEDNTPSPEDDPNFEGYPGTGLGY